MKREKRLFFRAFFISLVVFLCITLGIFMCAKAYENTLRIRFGEYRDAFEINENGIRFFDFDIKF